MLNGLSLEIISVDILIVPAEDEQRQQKQRNADECENRRLDPFLPAGSNDFQ